MLNWTRLSLTAFAILSIAGAASMAAEPRTASPSAQLPARGPLELRAAVEGALRRSAMGGDASPATSARKLLDVYQELRDDQRLAFSVRSQLGRTVRKRLANLAETIQRDAAGNRGAAPPILAQQLGAAQGIEGNPSGAATADHGPALVELIQSVIAPDIWDVNGGPATIVYFAPKMALVVRAPGDVHAELGGLLPQLRP